MSLNKEVYVVDANILISFGIFTPINIHKTFWSQLGSLIKKGSFVVIEDVAKECKYGDIAKWINTQNITEVSEDIRKESIEINNTYSLITQSGEQIKSEADPVIIAYAKLKECIVFTYEAKRRREEYPMKIPDVCEALGVEYQRWPNKVFKEIQFGEI